MKYDPEGMRELSWRRKLTAEEAARLRAWLESHPEARADFDVEAALTDTLGQLPDAPMPSNFTARVLQAVELEAARERRSRGHWFWRWRPVWVARAAAVAVVIGVGVFSVDEIHRARERADLARRLEGVPEIADVPRPEILDDFDARQLGNPAPDEQLLSLMSE
jgi:anti-sigma factor RsiW